MLVWDGKKKNSLKKHCDILFNLYTFFLYYYFSYRKALTLQKKEHNIWHNYHTKSDTYKYKKKQ